MKALKEEKANLAERVKVLTCVEKMDMGVEKVRVVMSGEKESEALQCEQKEVGVQGRD